MKKIIIISLSILIGCSEIGIIEKEIPFERKTVVYGRLEGGSEDLTLNFSRSFGLNEIYSKDDVSLVGVTAYIWSDVYGIFPLKDYGKGEYRPPNDFLIQFGEHYELHAKIENETVS